MEQLKFKVKHFLTHLTISNAVVYSKNSLPILSSVMVETKKDTQGNPYCILTTSDGETWLNQKVSLQDCNEGVKFCVRVEDMMKALKNLDDVDVVLTLDKDKSSINCNYGNGHFVMPYELTTDYPTPQIDTNGAVEWVIDGNKIVMAIEKTEYATGTDQLRPIMNGIHFDFFQDGMVTVATDGHKLAKYKDPSIQHDKEESLGFTLPLKPSGIVKDILKRNDDAVKLSFTDKNVVFSNSTFKLTSRLLEGKYPRYDSVIPTQVNITTHIDRANLIAAIKRVLPMGVTDTELISFKFNQGNLTISAEDLNFATSASETITYTGEQTTPITIGFKGTTMLQALQNLDDNEVTIEMTEPNKAAVLYEVSKNNFLSLLMPILIS